MRFLNKYKIHENFAASSEKLPLRVLKFKRPKWAKIKNKLKIRKFIWVFGKRLRKKPRFLNLLKIRVKKKLYCNKLFNIKLQNRKYLTSLFDSSVKIHRDKKQTLRRNVICSILVKPMFRIDLFLWYLKFFTSSWAARHVINSGFVCVNNKRTKLNYFIKAGDVISFDFPVSIESSNRYKIIKSKFLKNRFFLPFLEYDYYTNTFVVLKNWNDLSKNDLSLLFKNNKKVKYI